MSEIYNEIMDGLRETLSIVRGESKPASVVEFPDSPKQTREKLKLTQSQFAEFVGVNEYTLKNWEQGKRKIPAPARTLFKIAAAFPEVILQVRRNELKAAKRKVSARRRVKV